MKFFIKILIFFSSFYIVSCGNSSTTKEAVHEEHTHTEESNTATLTQEQIHAVGITLGKIEKKELTAKIRANGMLRVPNNNKGIVTSLQGGVVQSILVQVGDKVTKGQVIATIANPQFISLQEEYLTVSSKIVFAEQEVNRQKELHAGNAGALKNLQNATAELNTFRTRKASLEQQLQLLGIQPNSITNSTLKSSISITSPLNGVISNLQAKIGSFVDAASPVAEVVDNGSLHLDLHIFEKDLPLIKKEQIIHFTLTNNPTDEYDAQVFSIGSSFESTSKTISVHCKVTGDKTGLIDGMNISGIVSLNDATAAAVSNDAIVNVEGKDFIFIVVDNKTQKAESDEHEHSDEGHNHEHNEENLTKSPTSKDITFEKIEVLKGVSDMGFTAVTFIKDVPLNAKIVTKGAFFVLAKMSNTGEHEH